MREINEMNRRFLLLIGQSLYEYEKSEDYKEGKPYFIDLSLEEKIVKQMKLKQLKKIIYNTYSSKYGIGFILSENKLRFIMISGKNGFNLELNEDNTIKEIPIQ